MITLLLELKLNDKCPILGLYLLKFIVLYDDSSVKNLVLPLCLSWVYLQISHHMWFEAVWNIQRWLNFSVVSVTDIIVKFWRPLEENVLHADESCLWEAFIG